MRRSRSSSKTRLILAALALQQLNVGFLCCCRRVKTAWEKVSCFFAPPEVKSPLSGDVTPLCFSAVLSDYDSADPEDNGSHSEVRAPTRCDVTF